MKGGRGELLGKESREFGGRIPFHLLRISFSLFPWSCSVISGVFVPNPEYVSDIPRDDDPLSQQVPVVFD